MCKINKKIEVCAINVDDDSDASGIFVRKTARSSSGLMDSAHMCVFMCTLCDVHVSVLFYAIYSKK